MSTPDGPTAKRAPARSRREQGRLVAGAVALVIVTVFVVSNTQQVEIHWIVTTTRTPLIVALALCILIGIGATLLAGALRGRRRSRGGASHEP